jgi:hypothetical protein
MKCAIRSLRKRKRRPAHRTTVGDRGAGAGWLISFYATIMENSCCAGVSGAELGESCGNRRKEASRLFVNSDAWRHIMAISKLEKTQWKPYFDYVSKILVGKRAEIEVASLKIGDQIEAEWLPFLGIVYDHKNDLVEVLVEDLDHLIRKPVEIYIDVGPAGLTSVEVIDADDYRQIIKLRDPLMLPYEAPT